jgi:hypothetical protein
VLKLQPQQSTYTLPNEIIEVRQIYRRNAGGISASATDFEPFEAGYLNMYMLNAGRGGGLATFELYMGYREQMGKMFGAYIIFNWNEVSKQLHLQRKIRSDEECILHTYNYKPDEMLLADSHAQPWLKDYALATAKMALGQARSKFGSLAGPGGGVTLNGNDLIAQSQAEIEKLDQDLINYVDGGTPISFIFG